MNLCAIQVLFLSVGFLAAAISNNTCRRDCTTSTIGSENSSRVVSNIECSISIDSCPMPENFGQRRLNSNVPKELWPPLQPSWYSYKKSADDYSRLALNFTWVFTNDLSLEHVRGYSIQIKNTNTYNSSLFLIHFCFQSQLVYAKHEHAVFFYDCYGLTDSTFISPGDNLSILIKSFPDYSKLLGIDYNKLAFDVNVPDCGYPGMYDVLTCAIKRQLTVKVLRIFCFNHTIQYKYTAPNLSGQSARITFCHGEDDDNRMCLAKISQRYESKLSQTLWFPIPDSFFLSKSNFTVIVTVRSKRIWFARAVFNFSDCPVGVFIVSPVLVSLTCFLTVAVAMSILVYIKYKWCINIRNYVFKKPSDSSLSSQFETSFQTSVDLAPNITVTVYLLFTDDHPKHKEVVVRFARFLQEACGFDVIFELWDEENLYQNTTRWMEKSLQNADKVIVIWSPGATARWRHYYGCSASDRPTGPSNAGDLFTPVVEQIFKDLFTNSVLSKYYLAFFDYGDRNCFVVPQLQKQVSKIYCLMNDFQELYCCLKDVEMYRPGGMFQIEESDKSFRTELENNIKEMRNLASNCENWLDIAAYNVEVSETYPMLASSRETNEFFHLPPVYFVFKNENLSESFRPPLTDLVSVAERKRFSTTSIEPSRENTDPQQEMAVINKFITV